jgi:hypothetical protein
MNRTHLIYSLAIASIALLSLGVMDYASASPSQCNMTVMVEAGTNDCIVAVCEGECPVPPGDPCTQETQFYDGYSRSICYCAGQFPTFCKGNYQEFDDGSWTLFCLGICVAPQTCKIYRTDPYFDPVQQRNVEKIYCECQ